MKKILCFCLSLILIIPVLSGCSLFNNGELDPASAVRLLLAGERLNSSLLKNEGDIFENGSAVMRALSQKVRESTTLLDADSDRSAAMQVAPLAAQTVYEGKVGGGRVTLDGDKYIFSDFVEVSNSYSLFSEISNGIEETAEKAASLIDSIKKNVRVVDTWIVVNDMEQYYLHVGENEEVLYGRAYDDESVCRRYRNEEGANVYEYYTVNVSGHNTRMLYIPGLYFELTRGIGDDPYRSDYFVADRSKGYWESYWVGPHPDHYNVSYMVIKDDICYDSFYDPKLGCTNYLKIISSDKKTDIFDLQDEKDMPLASVTLKLCAFDGVRGAEADASKVSVEDMGGEAGRVPVITGSADALLLENGKRVSVGDSFFGGAVKVESIYVPFIYPNITGEVLLRIEAEGLDAKLDCIKRFINEVGLDCRRDLDTVVSGVYRANVELAEITKYYTWNGYPQATEQGIASAIAVEAERLAIYKDMIASVKDAPSVSINRLSSNSKAVHFAPITVETSAASQSELTADISRVTLSVTDTLLFIEGEQYTVGFALSGPDGLVHLEKAAPSELTEFTGGSSFSVSVSNVTLALPELVDGSYTLVAYFATHDGIRSSEYSPVSFDSASSADKVTLTRSEMSAAVNGSGNLVLSYESRADIYLTFSPDGALTYEQLYTLLATAVCEYGVPSDNPVEIMGENGYTAMTESESSITSGSFRLAYNVQNGSSTVNAYLYAELK